MQQQEPLESIIYIFDDKGHDAELAAIFTALWCHLGKSPTKYDQALCTQLPKVNNANDYTLIYNKKALGIIRRKYRFNNDKPFKVSFTPLEILN